MLVLYGHDFEIMSDIRQYDVIKCGHNKEKNTF